MTGPQPAGRPWTKAEEAELLELLAANAKVALIARKLKRSEGAIYARADALRRTWAGFQPRSLPSERLADAAKNINRQRSSGK